MDAQRAAKMGVDPAEVRITCHGGQYSGKWILWIPNDRYTEEDPRHRQILTESRDVFYLGGWKASLERQVHGS